ncbi:hypothetical protein [Streptomyces sp. NPDC056305]|uniref:hypothetical protein n=1 Tax=unclassified Streptomyces TaxID=2593676 RepID=UPI0035D76EC5
MASDSDGTGGGAGSDTSDGARTGAGVASRGGVASGAGVASDEGVVSGAGVASGTGEAFGGGAGVLPPQAREIADGCAVSGIALDPGALFRDGVCLPEAQVRIPLATLNRHELVAGHRSRQDQDAPAA